MNGTLGCPVCGATHIALGSTACQHCHVAFASPVVTPTVHAPQGAGATTLQAPAATSQAGIATYTPSLPAEEATAVSYASIWRRMAAGVVDMVLLAVPFIALVGPATYFADDTTDSGFNWVAPTATWEWAEYVVWLVYVVVMLTSRWQATVGMHLLEIRVVRDGTHEGLTGGRALGRELATVLSALTLGIGYLMIAFTAKRQALHDKVAGTVVLHDPR